MKKLHKLKGPICKVEIVPWWIVTLILIHVISSEFYLSNYIIFQFQY